MPRVNKSPASQGEKTYLCIDLKSFYASVECADRGLDPFVTDLVVADVERSDNTICLAITPALKAKGVHNRCRIRDIPQTMSYIAAIPRMRRYMEVSRDIYHSYLSFVAPQDIYPYSIDECFIDATPYLKRYHTSVQGFARRITAHIRKHHGIAATAGIGPNLFLAKLALDIMAKHADDGIGLLTYKSFREKLWFHHPLTDIWSIGPGIARRLAERNIFDLAGICAEDPRVLWHMFGKNAEHLIDHAWGLEPCTIADIRAYKPRGHSMSNGQVLMRDYTTEEARTVLREMAFASCLELTEKGFACDTVGLSVGYSHMMFAHSTDVLADLKRSDLYAASQRRLGKTTSSERAITNTLLSLFDENVHSDAKVRRITLSLGNVVPARFATHTLFDDREAEQQERQLSKTIVAVRKRFGANALLKGTSLKEGANARERNLQIGGHRA